MTHADQEAREATGAGGVLSQGRLTKETGRRESDSRRPPSPRYRLKRSIESFSASTGELYLLRVGTSDDFVLEEPTARDRILIEALAQGFTDRTTLAEHLVSREISIDDLDSTLDQLEEMGIVEREPEHPLLTQTQSDRYDRQLIYFSDLAGPGRSAEELQRQLSASRVVLIGCGGLGSWTACGLACAGVGSLVLVDDDRVELSNLNRQLLFSETDIGELKVAAAERALKRHNSELEVLSAPRRIRGTSDLHDVLPGADLLIVTADWPPYELPRWVNAACMETGTPYVTAGQLLPTVRVGPWVIPGQTACLECMERAWRRDYPMYEELVAQRAKQTPPAATLGAASGLVGSVLAMEAIHFLTGSSPPASLDAALVLDLRTMKLTREEVTRNPECPRCGEGRAAEPLTGHHPALGQLSSRP